MNRSSRRQPHRLPPGVRYREAKPRLTREGRGRQTRTWPRRWQLPAAVAVLVVVGILIAIRLWLQAQPAQPDEAALHADISAGRNGAEVTFNAIVVQAPANVGDHEQIQVKDKLGDQLELDYNLMLGRWIPVRIGDQLEVHGQLYIDPGRAGVHCLHAQTSSGCTEPGWVRYEGTTYS